MKDQYDEYEHSWDLTGEEDMTRWPNQTQTWYHTSRGRFVITRENNLEWFSFFHHLHTEVPCWIRWDGTLPWDIKNFDMTGEFDLDDIELAEIFMDELT